jgi:hypothetical protein
MARRGAGPQPGLVVRRRTASMSFDGPAGETHGGLTRLSCSRVTAQYPRNGRQDRHRDRRAKAKKKPIQEIGAKLGIPAEHLLPYGHDKAKSRRRKSRLHRQLARRRIAPDGKLILVTAINPTPAGEGKTTTTVGLGDGLNRIGKKAVVCIREASLGPNFGMKGGAAGGGYAQVVPMEDMNLHFTGDFHAITSGAQPAVGDDRQPHLLGQRARHRQRRVVWRRVMDMNDRALRDIVVLARRRRQRLPAPDRLRHHRGLRGHGDPVPRHRPQGPEKRSATSSSPTAATRRRSMPRPQGRRRDDRAAEGRDAAEPRADAGEQPGLRARRPVRQHRAWLQLGHRHHDRAEAGRLRRDRGRASAPTSAPRSSSTSSAARPG